MRLFCFHLWIHLQIGQFSQKIVGFEFAAFFSLIGQVIENRGNFKTSNFSLNCVLYLLFIFIIGGYKAAKFERFCWHFTLHLVVFKPENFMSFWKFYCMLERRVCFSKKDELLQGDITCLRQVNYTCGIKLTDLFHTDSSQNSFWCIVGRVIYVRRFKYASLDTKVEKINREGLKYFWFIAAFLKTCP